MTSTHPFTYKEYTLTIIKFETKAPLISVSSPRELPQLRVNESKVPTIEVNWAAIGNVISQDAREYAAKINEAADAADYFQEIIEVIF